MWDQPCRVGVFRGIADKKGLIETLVLGHHVAKNWICEDPREVASRCGVLIQGRAYRWLFHKTTGDLVGWMEVSAVKAEREPKDPMEGIEYETSGPQWNRRDAVGVITRYNEEHGIIHFIRDDGATDHFAPKNIVALKDRLGIPRTGKRYRFLFKGAKIVGWREEPLSKAEPAPEPKKQEPVGVPKEGSGQAGVFLRWGEARFIFKRDGGDEDFWCLSRRDREAAIARCGDMVPGKRYRWLWNGESGGVVLGWREEPLPKADTVSKHDCEMCGAETDHSYQDMAYVCNGCSVEFHNTLCACIHVAKAMYGDKARVNLYRGDPGDVWKVNVATQSRANTGIMGKNDGKRVRDAFEALCQEAVSPRFPHPDDGPLEARLDAIGEAAMMLGVGVYGAADR